MLRIGLLGGLRLEGDDRSLTPPDSRPGRVLLAWLALHPGAHGRSRLAGVLRPDAPEDAARQTLRQALWAIRRALGDDADAVLVATREEAGLRAEVVEVDTGALLARAGGGDGDAAAVLASTTLLPDLDDEWVLEARERLRADLAAACAAHVDGPDGVRWARLRVQLEPLSESAGRDLIRLLAESGDRAAAVQASGDLRRRLDDELGVPPSAETRALLDQLLRDEGTTAPPPAAPPPAPDAPAPALPPVLAGARERPIAGRADVLRALEAAWGTALEGSPSVVLMSGEPGIGKTRTAAEIAARAIDDGGGVLYGRCAAEQIVPYAPFVEAVDAPWAPLHALTDAQRAELGRLLPRLGDTTATTGGAARGPAAPDAEQARFLMFDALRAALDAASAARPCLVVLDDLHWADRSTAAMLSHVARSLAGQPLMLLLTFRDTDVAPGHPVAQPLLELRREHRARELRLEPLGEADVEELLSGAEDDTRDARALHRRTGGNPLFLVESLRAGDEGDVPVVVRDLIEQRIAALGDEAAAVLRAAAVAGAEFDLALVAAATSRDLDAVLSAAEAAAAGGLVREVGDSPGRFTFTHALVRDAVHETTSATRRARLHAELGRALAERRGPAPAVASHLLAAGPLADGHEVAGWVGRAAGEELEALAYESAAELYERALAQRDGATGASLAPADRARLLIGLARALDLSGRRRDARIAARAAAAAARTAGDGTLLGRAALAHRGSAVTIAAPDQPTVMLLEEALGAGGLDEGVQARATAALALEVFYADQPRAEELSARAVDVARASGDPAALAEALSARHTALWSAEAAHERLAVARQMGEAAAQASEPGIVLQARQWLILDLMELGRIDVAEHEIGVYAAEVERLRLPAHAWYVPLWRAALAIFRGEFEDAERLSVEAFEAGTRAQDGNAALFRSVQRQVLLTDMGRIDLIDAAEPRRQSIVSAAGGGTWLGWVATILAGHGDLEGARRAFERLAANGFALLPRHVNWHAVCDAAEAAAALGDAERAAELIAWLEPYPDLNPVIARGLGMRGPVTHFLGRLRVTTGEFARAIADLEAAHATLTAWRARPRAALTRLYLADALDGAGDARRAAAERAEALAEMERLGVQPPRSSGG
jgi:DNA-binding SARP family transcriptional activator